MLSGDLRGICEYYGLLWLPQTLLRVLLPRRFLHVSGRGVMRWAPRATPRSRRKVAALDTEPIHVNKWSRRSLIVESVMGPVDQWVDQVTCRQSTFLLFLCCAFFIRVNVTCTCRWRIAGWLSIVNYPVYRATRVSSNVVQWTLDLIQMEEGTDPSASPWYCWG